MKVSITRKFDAAHRLWRDEWSEEENRSMFGKCCGLHGHTWFIEAEVEGEVLNESGMLIDFRELKLVVDALDHKYLNDIISLPTAENVASYLVESIKCLGAFNSVRVVVYESQDCFAEDCWIAE